MRPLPYSRNVTLGCDPEFFFTGSKGETTGAEKVLPKDGITYTRGTDARHLDGMHTAIGDTSRIVIDGVQAELNPRPNPCRANLGNEIGACFRSLKKTLEDKGMKVSFAPVVKVSRKEMNSLSDQSKIFGCAPSTNVYAKESESKILVDPKKYLKRSAGGHVHLGAERGCDAIVKALKNVEVLVPMLDAIVGNTCVLIDRDPNNAERRKNYGRAGEHRVKEYGMEYRTLSNFWLQSYQLMSLVMGLSRLAVHIVAYSTKENDYVAAIMKAVDQKDIVKAINENDFALAYDNFMKIEAILLDATGTHSEDYPFTRPNIDAFHFFISKGVNHWFKEDPFQHWLAIPEGHGTGWETFLKYTISAEMKAASTTLAEIKSVLDNTRCIHAGLMDDLKLKIAALKGLKAMDPSPVKRPAKKKLVAVETLKPAEAPVAVAVA